MEDIAIKLNKNKQDIIDFCGKHNRIFIFGAGYVGKLVYDLITDAGIMPQGYIVSDKEKINSNSDADIYAWEYSFYQRGDGIIISVDYKHQQEIMLRLIKDGVHINDLFVQQIYISYDSLISGQIGNNSSGDYFGDYQELDRSGVEYGTDKNSCFHNYLRKYEFFLNRFKNNTFVLLELGVYKGNSLKMWGKYFRHADIVGVDINKDCRKYSGENIQVLNYDLSRKDSYEALKELKPKIIIDDASHIWSHQIMALVYLFPFLPSGGVYIVEDLETSLGSIKRKTFYADSNISAYEFLAAVAEAYTGDLTLDDESGKYDHVKSEILNVAVNVDMISFIHGSCIIIKK